MTEEPRRTVAVEHDLPRVREWIDQAVRHAVNEAAQAFNAIRYWCDTAESIHCGHIEGDLDAVCAWCDAVKSCGATVRDLLPDLPAVRERRAEPAGGGGDMEQQGTRANRDRDLAIGGEDGNQAAVRGDDDDRDL